MTNELKLSPLHATAPRKIYLQISDDPDHSSEPFPENWRDGDITWCAESVQACEVAYVRADIAAISTEPSTLRRGVGVRSATLMLPTYFVKHPDGSYTEADPQPEVIVMLPCEPTPREYTPPGPLQWDDGGPPTDTQAAGRDVQDAARRCAFLGERLRRASVSADFGPGNVYMRHRVTWFVDGDEGGGWFEAEGQSFGEAIDAAIAATTASPEDAQTIADALNASAILAARGSKP
jgi:hypothetical protein